MIDHIGIDVSDYERSRSFYEKALKPIGYKLLMDAEGFAGFGPEKTGGSIANFWIRHETVPTRDVRILGKWSMLFMQRLFKQAAGIMASTAYEQCIILIIMVRLC